MNSMLLKTFSSWNELAKTLSIGGGEEGWLVTLLTVLSTVLWVCLALVGAAGGIYAVYVGIKMARADSAEQREENKKRLINIIVSIVVVIVLIIFFNVFLPMIIGAFTDDEGNFINPSNSNTVRAMMNTAKVLLRV